MVVQVENGVGFIAGKPAPTGSPQDLKAVVILWELACRR
jgi:hypothetical protein